MHISYDPKYNIAYIKLRDKRDVVKTLHISDEVNLDISPDGKVYGIELLNTNAQLKGAGRKLFTLTNESIGKTVKIPLPA